jgi:hypothetical protein
MGIITREIFMIKLLEFKEHRWDIQEALRGVATRGRTVDCRKIQFTDLKRMD